MGKMTLEKLAALVVESVDELRSQMVTSFEIVHNDIQELRQDSREVKGDISLIQKDISEIRADSKGHGKAIDSDAKSIINHEVRIKKLEHAR